MSVRKLIDDLYQAYGERDLEKTASFVSQDFKWIVPIEEGEAPFGGSTNGSDAMLKRMRKLDDTFEYLDVKPNEFLVDGDQAAVRITFRLKCKSGGDPFELDCCHFWHTKDGKITQVTEVYDTGLMSKNMC